MPTGGQIGKLLCLDLSLVRSKLDYGCILYKATSKHILKKLDPIHHQSLQIALEAFRTSPVTSLYAKVQEIIIIIIINPLTAFVVQDMSLNNRRKILFINCLLK